MPRESLYDELEKWRNREINIARLFSGDTIQSRYYQVEKLKHFRQLRTVYSLDILQRKDISFGLLKGEIAKLERTLYPQPVLRLLRRTLNNIQSYFGPERLLNHVIKVQEDKRQQDVVADALKQLPIKDAAMMMNQPLTQTDSLKINTTIMNDQNFAAISRQLKDTGFGEGLNSQLREKMQQGEDKFMLTFQQNFNKDSTVSTLHFKKEGDDYQFQRFNLMMKKNGFDEPLKQTFFINQGQENFTLKEGYNLLSGRGVLKDLQNREGQSYQAWKQLDFKQTDPYGNFKMHTYGEKYGYEFEASLNKHTIKEFQDPAKKAELMQSLKEGNQVSITIVRSGQETKMMMEAAPRFKSLNFYEMTGLKVRAEKLYDTPQQSKGQQAAQDTGKQQKNDATDDIDAPKKNVRRRKGQSIG